MTERPETSEFRAEYESLNQYYKDCQDVIARDIDNFKRLIKEFKRKIWHLESDRRQFIRDHKWHMTKYMNDSEDLLRRIENNERKARQAPIGRDRVKAWHNGRAKAFREELVKLNEKQEKYIKDLADRRAAVEKQMKDVEKEKEGKKEDEEDDEFEDEEYQDTYRDDDDDLCVD